MYPAGETALACLEGGGGVAVKSAPQGLLLDGPGASEALVFYPGAKVEYTAYLPLLTALARDGVDCFLVKMPANLAFLGRNRAGEIMEANPSYERWYLAGHSLGGAMAADWAAGHPGRLAGLGLLAAYPTKPLPEALPVAVLYGEADGVLNRKRLAAGRALLPESALVEALPGGNHAGFGDYGPQRGDGEATVDPRDQWDWAAARLEACFGAGSGAGEGP